MQRACKCDLAIRTLEVEKRTLTEALSAAAAQAAALQHAHMLAETRAEAAEGLRAAAQRRADNAEAECARLRAALSAGERSARAGSGRSHVWRRCGCRNPVSPGADVKGAGPVAVRMRSQ